MTWQRFPRNRHHLTPRSNFKHKIKEVIDRPENILLIDITKHDLWHKLWGNKSLEEVLALLHRLKRAKRRTKRYEAEEARHRY